MNEAKRHIEQLKYILENLRSPERLDNHPWATSLTVQEKIAQDPSLIGKGPGYQLALTLSELFLQLMPTTPPQNGKRLDTRWGRFGILAANYFAPFLFGRLQPHSLRDAWRRIDQSILLFVYNLPANQLKPEQVKPYQLIGDELDFPANSTISDWHRSGLQELADLFVNHENHLSVASGKPSSLLNVEESAPSADVAQDRNGRVVSGGRISFWHWEKYLILAVLLVGLIFLGINGFRLARLAQAVRGDISALENLNPASLVQRNWINSMRNWSKPIRILRRSARRPLPGSF